MTTSSDAPRDPLLLDVLRTVRFDPRDPASPDLVKGALVREARRTGSLAEVTLEFPSPQHPRAAALAAEVRDALRAAPGIEDARVLTTWSVRAAEARVEALPGVRNVLCVASGKGGVGKSTIASNLAVGLRLAGAKTGLLDLDVYGPTGTVVMGSDATPEMGEDERMIPPVVHGVSFRSMGMLAPGDRPVVWRGPMLHKAVMQLASADWGDLDYLVLDLPPGTGDVQLTVTQALPVAGALIVTTPQTIALLDAAKGLSMFEGARIPILGLVENMAGYVCPKCGKRHAIFAEDGGRRLAERSGVPLLARIPLDPALGRAGDAGHPVVLEEGSPAGDALRGLAIDTAAALGARSLRKNPFKVLA